jgi:hypothetical protein
VNGEMNILIEHLIHQDRTKYKANEPEMNIKMEIVVAKNKAVVESVRELKMTAHDVERDI